MQNQASFYSLLTTPPWYPATSTVLLRARGTQPHQDTKSRRTTQLCRPVLTLSPYGTHVLGSKLQSGE